MTPTTGLQMDAEAAAASITNGELSRAVGLIRSDIRDLKKEIDARPTANDILHLEQRWRDAKTVSDQAIKDLEDWQRWAMRVGVPGIVLVLFNVFVTVENRLPL